MNSLIRWVEATGAGMLMLGTVAATNAGADTDFSPFEHEGKAAQLATQESGHVEFVHEGTTWSLMNWGKRHASSGRRGINARITASADFRDWRVHLGWGEEGTPYAFVSSASAKSPTETSTFQVGWSCGRGARSGWAVEMADSAVGVDDEVEFGLTIGKWLTAQVDNRPKQAILAKETTVITGAGGRTTRIQGTSQLWKQIRAGRSMQMDLETTYERRISGWGESKKTVPLITKQITGRISLMGSTKALEAGEEHCAQEARGAPATRKPVCAEEREDFFAAVNLSKDAMVHWGMEAMAAAENQRPAEFREALGKQCFMAVLTVQYMVNAAKTQGTQCRAYTELTEYTQTMNAAEPVIKYCTDLEFLPGQRHGVQPGG